MTQTNIPAATILVVDDFADIRSSLRLLLENHGYNVIEAQDGREAVKVAMGGHPDLILMDLFMPNHDGFAAAREILNKVGTIGLPIVATSAYGELGIEGNLRQQAHNAGFVEYMAKPFDSDKLLELIERLLLKKY
jgi:CheY-like chemotaxis protein